MTIEHPVPGAGGSVATSGDDGDVQRIAHAILDGFDKHYLLFRRTSAEARERFERADWAAVQHASRERIDMYDQRVREATAAVLERFPEMGNDRLWPRVKQAYIALLYDHKQPECAETFFNSVACRALDRTYYRNRYIFWRPAVSTEFIEAEEPTYRSWYPGSLRRTLADIVASFGLTLPFENLRRDLRHVLRAFREHFPSPREQHPNFQIQVLRTLFYRNKAGYVVGRIISGNREHPFAIPVRHSPRGGSLYLDALLLDGQHIGTLFSLARAYFFVDMEVPSAYVTFLRQIMPTKSPAELYTAVGLQKQGKTLFYRDLQEHLRHSSDAFVTAPGARGMVMMVFTLPSFPYVFKVIRDSFAPPKQTTREEVMKKYLMVKYHDRVGRMADTLEYSHVAFPLDRIHPGMLDELEKSCTSTVERNGDQLVIKHLYIERRMIPLDLWLRNADGERERSAIYEFGQAIREMAQANIFPGDLLLKNFGVTRWGRVVFYDYDEISILTEMRFRSLPVARDDGEEMSSEPWFNVEPNDVFPEEFLAFLFPPGRQRSMFVQMHGALLTPAWWRACQEEIRSGRFSDFRPYPAETRFEARFGPAPTSSP